MKTLSIKQFVFGAILAGTASLALASQEFVFDPDGGGGDIPILVSSFDWSPGNALSVGAVPVPLNPDTKPNTTYYQAKLSNFLGSNSLPIVGTDLNKTYEITIVVGFGEFETGLDLNGDLFPETALFNFDPANPVNFVRIYFDDTPDATALDGTGYNDGVLILDGTVTNTAGPFNVTSATGVALDQFVNNDFPGVNSVTGNGGIQSTMNVQTFNAAFFTGAVPKSLAFNTSIILPYKEVDPSKLFTNDSNVLFSPVIGALNGITGPDLILQADANNSFTLEEIIQGACRMTGGGVTDDGQLILDPTTGEAALPAADSDGKNRYTFGGQVGAPSASAPNPFGEWTHHQYKGPAGDFVFHAGSSSSPSETRVLAVTCSDPGFCNPARPAPFHQLDWEGTGSFRNLKNNPTLAQFVVTDNNPNFTIHYVKVHVEDIGEPGPGGKQPKSDTCTHTIGEPIATADCTNCPDVYQIEIHKTADPASEVIYSVGGFIDTGNIQIHPAIQ